MSRDLSHETRELLVLARGDAPPPRSRDHIWDGLERAILPAAVGAVGIGTAAAVAKPAAAIATNPSAWVPQAAAAAVKPAATTWISAIASAKLAVGAALVGSVAAISVAGGVMHNRMTPTLVETDPRPSIVYDESVVTFNAPSFPAQFSGTAAPSPSPAPPTAKEEARAVQQQAVARASLTSPSQTRGRASSDDTLLREASLVGEARSALLRGDPQTALVSVQAARREGRNLEPEELSIEARALRALGREPEAAQLDTTLRNRYPTHALAANTQR